MKARQSSGWLRRFTIVISGACVLAVACSKKPAAPAPASAPPPETQLAPDPVGRAVEWKPAFAQWPAPGLVWQSDRHKAPVGDMAFSPDGRWVATASYDGSVRLCETTSGREVRTLDFSDLARDTEKLDWEVRDLLAAGAPLALAMRVTYPSIRPRLMTPATVRGPVTVRGNELIRSEMSVPLALRFSGDGRLLVCRSGLGVKVWEVDTGAVRFHLTCWWPHISELTPGGRYLLYVPGKIKAQGGEISVNQPGMNLRGMDVVPDVDLVMVDLRSGREVVRDKFLNMGLSPRFAADGRHCLATYSNGARLFDFIQDRKEGVAFFSWDGSQPSSPASALPADLKLIRAGNSWFDPLTGKGPGSIGPFGLAGSEVPDDRRVICLFDRDQSLRVWDLRLGRELARFREPWQFQSPTNAAVGPLVSPDQRMGISAHADDRVRLWSFPKPDAVSAPLWTPPLDPQAPAREVATISLWGAIAGHERLMFTPDGLRLLVSHGGLTAVLSCDAMMRQLDEANWDYSFADLASVLNTSNWQQKIGTASPVPATAGGRGAAKFLETAFANPLAGVSADGRVLATMSAYQGQGQGRIMLWDLNRREPAGVIEAGYGSLNNPALVGLLPDGRTIVTAGENPSLRLLGFDFGRSDGKSLSWNPPYAQPTLTNQLPTAMGRPAPGSSPGLVVAPNGLLIATLAGKPASGVAVQPGAAWLRVWSWGWTAATKAAAPAIARRALFTFELPAGQAGGDRQLTFSPDSGRLAHIGADKSIRTLTLNGGKWNPVLSGHGRAINDVAFAADNRTLVSVAGVKDEAGEILVWDAATGTQAGRLDAHRFGVVAVACHPQKPYFVTLGHDETLRVWKLASAGDRAAPPATAAAQGAR